MGVKFNFWKLCSINTRNFIFSIIISLAYNVERFSLVFIPREDSWGIQPNIYYLFLDKAPFPNPHLLSLEKTEWYNLDKEFTFSFLPTSRTGLKDVFSVPLFCSSPLPTSESRTFPAVYSESKEGKFLQLPKFLLCPKIALDLKVLLSFLNDIVLSWVSPSPQVCGMRRRRRGNTLACCGFCPPSLCSAVAAVNWLRYVICTWWLLVAFLEKEGKVWEQQLYLFEKIQ